MDSELAKPFTLKCGLTLPNRLVKAAMAENLADSQYLPTSEQFHRAYGAWADGEWGMVLTGNVQVDVTHLGQAHDVALNLKDQSALLRSWKSWASTGSRNGTPLIMQISHPGKQSPVGSGERGFWTKTMAPSAIPLNLGSSIVAKVIRSVVFGTPREMNQQDIQRVIKQFADTARLASEAGFQGVQIHGAHGYLLAQFLSEKSNHRTDAYGGSPAARAKLAVDVITAIREAVPPSFAVGIKLNSVDHQSASELADCIEQLKLIVDAGVDFLEISGGTYEDPKMIGDTSDGKQVEKSARTKAREAFFLEFAEAIRGHFPGVPLMVTGGFRTRLGMAEALGNGACDFIGIARPACLNPLLPKNTILNREVKDEDARLYTRKPQIPWIATALGIGVVGAGAESLFYVNLIQKL